MKKYINLTVFLYIIVISQTLFSQTEIQITDEYGPVAEAIIVCSFKEAPFHANNNGIFTLPGDAPDSFEIEVISAAHKPFKKLLQKPFPTKIDLVSKIDNLNEVVISATRTKKRRSESAVAVNIIPAKHFETTQSTTLSEGLCFQPGLRVETDCQTCNFTQLRMNGLAGSYSQILINSRPIFSSLMSLYSLEQIPTDQIERVEIVRGGGSVLYGANAIAGTVNILTKTPKASGANLKQSFASIKGQSMDYQSHLNANYISKTGKFGILGQVNLRNRQAYDANGDGFTELPELRNESFGGTLFYIPRKGHKLETSFWKINEYRRGGNKLDLPADETDQAEERFHDIWVGTLDYNINPLNRPWSINTYFATQYTTRDHYTGIEGSPGWGNTESYTLMGGTQYVHYLKKHELLAGVEFSYEDTYDAIPGYNYLVDQTTYWAALFLQDEWKFLPKWTLQAGLRINPHNFLNEVPVLPRVNLLYAPTQNWQFRAGVATGFKPPQAFETDMHIAFAGGGISRIVLDPTLEKEQSRSYSLSADFNQSNEKMIYGFTLEGFFTNLFNPFVLEDLGNDADGNQILLRTNGSKATVYGTNLELRLNYNQKVEFESGLTLQHSFFQTPVYWSDSLPGETQFLRTPNAYGYFALTGFLPKEWTVNLSGVYTGTMKVPHVAGAPETDKDILFNSPTFWEIHFKVSKNWKLAAWLNMELSGGVQNIFDAYQSDFDSGPYRDSNYIYGPAKPRTYFLNLRFKL